jgi:hypothetical protein
MSETRSEKLDPRVERLLALILEARKARLASGAPGQAKPRATSPRSRPQAGAR